MPATTLVSGQSPQRWHRAEQGTCEESHPPHPSETSPTNTCSWIFPLQARGASDEEMSPSLNTGVLYVWRRERKSTDKTSLMFAALDEHCEILIDLNRAAGQIDISESSLLEICSDCVIRCNVYLPFTSQSRLPPTALTAGTSWRGVGLHFHRIRACDHREWGGQDPPFCDAKKAGRVCSPGVCGEL